MTACAPPDGAVGNRHVPRERCEVDSSLDVHPEVEAAERAGAVGVEADRQGLAAASENGDGGGPSGIGGHAVDERPSIAVEDGQAVVVFDRDRARDP